MTQPWRAPIDHFARYHRHRAISVFGKRGPEWLPAVGNKHVILLKRKRLIALIHQCLPAHLQIDGIVIGGRSTDVALGPDVYVAGGFARRKAKRTGGANCKASGKPVARRIRRNVHDRIANHFAPIRKALALIDCVGGPEVHDNLRRQIRAAARYHTLRSQLIHMHYKPNIIGALSSDRMTRNSAFAVILPPMRAQETSFTSAVSAAQGPPLRSRRSPWQAHVEE